MKPFPTGPFLLLALSATATLHAGIDVIPADRRTVWNPGIPGGIPSVTTIHTTIDAAVYGDGTTDATAAINSAIQNAGDAASSGTRQVVYLPPGTYLTLGTIQMNRSGVVLRGAGPTLTRIRSSSDWGVALGQIWPEYPWTVFDLQADALKGATSLKVSNADASTILVGDVLQIDQQDPFRRCPLPYSAQAGKVAYSRARRTRHPESRLRGVAPVLL